MRARKEFVLGQLAWITSQVGLKPFGLLQTLKGYPRRIALVPGTPCTIIRGAFAKDYGTFARDVYNGRSRGKELARTSWLTLYDGEPVMIDGTDLVKRFHRPRGKR